MDPSAEPSIATCHVVAMPFPGRGHINPMMNLCKLLALRKSDILITFVVTEEWLGYICSDPMPKNIHFATIPNVIPPERLKAADFPAFYEAVMMKMEAPFEQLLDRLEPPVASIIGDIELLWPVGVGNRRNIPVASFWTMSASFFSMLHEISRFVCSRHLAVDWLENSDEQVDQIPEISSTQKADLRTVLQENDKRVLQLALTCISQVSNSNFLLFTSIYELEPQTYDSLRTKFSFPVYPIGPSIPYFELETKKYQPNTQKTPNYLQWLDSQPSNSVLYISLGSFLKVSEAQMDEIASGLKQSGVSYLWVARGEASRLKEMCSEKGFVVSWCDQLRVLCHSSIGGFWSHCGWNSTLESVYSGVPLLTFPLFLDQLPNSTQIVEDWKVGCRIKRSMLGSEILVKKDKVSEAVKKFMDVNSKEGMEMRNKAKELRDVCHRAVSNGGSSDCNLDGFIRNVCE